MSNGERVSASKGEPPSSSAPSCTFYLGKDSHGNWVVQDQKRRRGGLFVDRTEALKFAMFESGRPQAVVMVPGIFELEIRDEPRPTARATLEIPLRQVA